MLVGIPTCSGWNLPVVANSNIHVSFVEILVCFFQWSLRSPMLFEYALVAHYGSGQTSIQSPRVRSIDLYKQILCVA